MDDEVGFIEAALFSVAGEKCPLGFIIDPIDKKTFINAVLQKAEKRTDGDKHRIAASYVTYSCEADLQIRVHAAKHQTAAARRAARIAVGSTLGGVALGVVAGSVVPLLGTILGGIGGFVAGAAVGVGVVGGAAVGAGVVGGAAVGAGVVGGAGMGGASHHIITAKEVFERLPNNGKKGNLVYCKPPIN